MDVGALELSPISSLSLLRVTVFWIMNLSLDGGASMRDRRFVAVHRGGPLDLAKHRLLAAVAELGVAGVTS